MHRRASVDSASSSQRSVSAFGDSFSCAAYGASDLNLDECDLEFMAVQAETKAQERIHNAKGVMGGLLGSDNDSACELGGNGGISSNTAHHPPRRDGTTQLKHCFNKRVEDPTLECDVKEGGNDKKGGSSRQSSSRQISASAFSDPSSPTGSQSDKTSDKGTGNIGNPDEAKKEENDEEEILYEVYTRCFKIVEKKWENCGTGVLCLCCHKRSYMVLRNTTTGQVEFNAQISKGMMFRKVVKETDKGKSTYVTFGTVGDTSKGVEKFMLQVKPRSVNKLLETLVEMAE